MNTKQNKPVQVTLRIPGNWSDPNELLRQIPADYRMEIETLVLPCGHSVEWIPLPRDEQFAKVFQTVCRPPALQTELDRLRRYSFKLALVGPGGSIDAARLMLQAGAAIVKAGGIGVFIDNSSLAHCGNDWVEMAEDGTVDAVSFAFVGMVGGPNEISTTGMHVLGLPDISVDLTDAVCDGNLVIDLIQYMCESDRPIENGHFIAPDMIPRFVVSKSLKQRAHEKHPMYNPFGRLQLKSLKVMAEDN